MIALKCPVCGNPVDEAIDGGCTKRCDDIFHGVEEEMTQPPSDLKNEMPDAIYAYQTYEGSFRAMDRPCSAGSTVKYVRADLATPQPTGDSAKALEEFDRFCRFIDGMHMGGLVENDFMHKNIQKLIRQALTAPAQPDDTEVKEAILYALGREEAALKFAIKFKGTKGVDGGDCGDGWLAQANLYKTLIRAATANKAGV